MTDFLSKFLEKQASLAGKVEDKESNLGIAHTNPITSSVNPAIESSIYELGRILDGDTLAPATQFGTSYNDLRLGSLESGYSLDAPETYKPADHPFWNNQKNIDRVERQRETLSKILGREASNEEVFQWGENVKGQLEEALYKDQPNYSEEGPIRPKIEVKQTGQIDKYNRPVTEVFNPVTGESLTQALNTKLTNTGYYQGYNQAQITKDIEAGVPIRYDRTAVEHFKDVLTSVGKGAEAVATGVGFVGDTAVDAINATAQKAILDPINSIFGSNLNVYSPEGQKSASYITDTITQGYKEIGKLFDVEKSDTLKFKESFYQSAEALDSKANNDQYIADISKGMNPLLAVAKREFNNTLGSVESLYDNIDVTLSMLPEQVIHLIGPAMAGNLMIKAGTTLGKQASKKEIIDLGAKGALAYTGIVEGGSAGAELKEEILKTPVGMLQANSDYFNELVAKGINPEEARAIVADKAGKIGFLLIGAVAGGISKLTGAANVEGNLLTRGVFNRLGDWIIKNPARETLEEGLQEMSSTLINNVVTQSTIDKDQEITEGAGKAFGTGAVLGLGSSVTMPAVSATGALTGAAITGTPNAIKASVEAIKNAPENIAGKVERTKEFGSKVAGAFSSTKGEEALTDENIQADPENAWKAVLSIGVNTDDKTELARRVNNARKVIDKLEEDMSGFEEGSEEYNTLADSIRTKEKDLIGLLRHRKEQQTKSTPLELAEKLATATSPVSDTDTYGNDPDAFIEDLVAADDVPVEKVQAVLDNQNLNLSENQKNVLNAYIKLNSAMNTGEVRKEVLGTLKDSRSRGLKDYREAMAAAVMTNNKQQARKEVGQLGKFLESHKEKAIKFTKALDIANRIFNKQLSIKQAQEQGATVEAYQYKDKQGNTRDGYRVVIENNGNKNYVNVNKKGLQIFEGINESVTQEVELIRDTLGLLKAQGISAFGTTKPVPATPTTETYNDPLAEDMERVDDAGVVIDQKAPEKPVEKTSTPKQDQGTTEPVTEPTGASKPVFNKESSKNAYAGFSPFSSKDEKGENIVWGMRNSKNKFKNYGNPFGVTGVDTIATVPNAGTGEEVSIKYYQWLNNDPKFKDVEPERRKWIQEQVANGNINSKTRFNYFKPAGNNITHIDALHQYILDQEASKKPSEPVKESTPTPSTPKPKETVTEAPTTSEPIVESSGQMTLPGIESKEDAKKKRRAEIEAKAKNINNKKDSLGTAIAKLGGLSLEKLGGDFKDAALGIFTGTRFPVFTGPKARKQNTVHDLAEALYAEGYISEPDGAELLKVLNKHGLDHRSIYAVYTDEYYDAEMEYRYGGPSIDEQIQLELELEVATETSQEEIVIDDITIKKNKLAEAYAKEINKKLEKIKKLKEAAEQIMSKCK